MKITKAEYCQFSLRGRVQLLKDFGKIIGNKIINYTGTRFLCRGGGSCGFGTTVNRL